ncbi:acyltransferase [Phormidium tenue FACHB-886]|nr:acyltransferase [Phormidium tenue FACHB-886]
MQNLPSIAPSKPDQSAVRLRYLDGLRGLAALYVVLFHAYQEADPELDGNEFSIAIQFATRWLTHGRFSVAVFIVLSGYCLMLPVMRSADGQLRGGFWNYLKRRSQRILPPYYAALVLSLLLFIFIPESLYPRMGMHWEFAYPVFTVGNLLSHAALVHNLHPDWIFKINGPMWSVATEWQIYFLFALVLLPLWRFLGLTLTVAIAIGVGLLPYFLLPEFLLEACFWYLGLFAFGMAAAVASFSVQPALVKNMPWGKLGIGLLVIAIAIRLWNGLPVWEGRIVEDFVVGGGIACLLVAWTHQLTGSQTKPSAILQLLQSRWAVALGMFSYSLYLVHMPVLGVAQLALSFLNLSDSKTLLALLTIVTPLSMLCAYGFYRVFERRDGLQRSLERVFASR